MVFLPIFLVTLVDKSIMLITFNKNIYYAIFMYLQSIDKLNESGGDIKLKLNG